MSTPAPRPVIEVARDALNAVANAGGSVTLRANQVDIDAALPPEQANALRAFLVALREHPNAAEALATDEPIQVVDLTPKNVLVLHGPSFPPPGVVLIPI